MRYLLLAVGSAVVIILDQWSKVWAGSALSRTGVLPDKAELIPRISKTQSSQIGPMRGSTSASEYSAPQGGSDERRSSSADVVARGHESEARVAVRVAPLGVFRDLEVRDL